jgi:HSP20 family protein
MTLIPWRKKNADGGSQLAESPVRQLRHEVDSLFDRFFHQPLGGFDFDALPAAFRGFPKTDLSESDEQITVEMELPGVDPAEVRIDLTAGLLTVRGEKKQDHEEKRQNYHFVERQYGSFQRTVQLPGTADTDKVEATFKDGVLTITVAKQPGAKPRRIEVKAQ